MILPRSWPKAAGMVFHSTHCVSAAYAKDSRAALIRPPCDRHSKLGFRMRWIHRACLVAALTCLGFDAYAGTPIKVFLLSGQSNMRGRASVNGLAPELLTPREDVLVCRGSQETVGTQLEFLQPNDPALDGATFGPDLTFGHTIANSFPDTRFALLKYAQGGTGIGSWAETSTVGIRFRQTVANGLALLEDAGYEPEIIGMLWHQGESNSGNTQAQYELALTNFIAEMRATYRQDMPFMIGEIRRVSAGTNAVADAQIAVGAADPYAVFVPAADLTSSDNVHFDRRGMVTLGERFAHYYAASFETLILGPGSETTLPTLTTTNPANGATVSVVTSLVADFSEYVVLSGSGQVTIKNLDDASGASDEVIHLPDPRITANGPRITIQPSSPLDFGTNYAIRISSDAVVDLAGNPFGGILTDDVWFFSTQAAVPPALVIYEPFNFVAPDTTLNGNAGGTGLSGNWTVGNGSIQTSNLTYGALPTSGSAVVASGYGASSARIGIGATTLNGLLNDGGELWMSFLYRYGGNAVNTRFAIGLGDSHLSGNGNLFDEDANPATAEQAIGFASVFGSNNGDIPMIWDTNIYDGSSINGDPTFVTPSSTSPGLTSGSSDGYGFTPANDTTYLIVLHAQWGADAATNDKVTLYTPGTDLTPGAAIATYQAIVSQDSFDTLFFTADQNIGILDEIRVGAIYADVLPSPVPTSAFDAWGASGTVTGVTFGGDANGDGVSDGIAFLLGAGSPDTNSTSLLPWVLEDDGLMMGFKMRKPSESAPAVLCLEHSGDLGISDEWASVVVPAATGSVGGVDFIVTEDPGDPTRNTVTATIPSSGNTSAGKLFGRLNGKE